MTWKVLALGQVAVQHRVWRGTPVLAAYGLRLMVSLAILETLAAGRPREATLPPRPRGRDPDGGRRQSGLGRRLTPELIEAVAQSASGPAKPLDNTDLSTWYRKRMSRVYIARALRELAGLPPVPAA